MLYKNETVADAVPDAIAAAQDFCEGYKTFLDNAKTEREATAYSEKLLTAAGYQKFVPGTSYAPGTKVYTINREKCVLAATIGTKNLEEGFHLNIAHIDSPRLDLRPVPVFEKTGIGYLRTHYYGGVRKYQWPTIPLALHGVIYRADGTRVNVCIGEKDDDPVFCITDLLPHLGAKQSAKTLAEGITAEDLNVIIASLPIEDKDAEQRVKLNVLGMLNEAYGITERDFTRAEIEVVPAYKARDIGLDRAMIGAYGHDDRVDAYPALMAEIGTKSPAYTSVCVLTDKEETGSDGVTGLNSMYTFLLDGGLSVVVEEARVFIPASLVSDTYEKNLGKYDGQEISFVITEFNPRKRRIIGDRKQLLLAEKAQKQKELFERINIGDVVEGKVKNVTDFGAFIDLGGADGLLHISEMSWGRVENPKKLLKVGDDITVLIKDIQGEKIALSLKFADQNPWLTAAEKYAAGNIVEGKVARMTDFGAFIELEPGVDALLHVSQISREHVEKPADVLQVGEIITAKVVDFNEEERKISLSIKAMEMPAREETAEE